MYVNNKAAIILLKLFYHKKPSFISCILNDFYDLSCLKLCFMQTGKLSTLKIIYHSNFNWKTNNKMHEANILNTMTQFLANTAIIGMKFAAEFICPYFSNIVPILSRNI